MLACKLRAVIVKCNLLRVGRSQPGVIRLPRSTSRGLAPLSERPGGPGGEGEAAVERLILALAFEEAVVERLILALAFCGLALAPAATAIHAEELFVAPGSGRATDVFTFVGRGFQPGAELSETYTGPGGVRYSFFFGDQPAVVVVGPDGGFELSLVPARDFEGAATGRWTAELCLDDGGCWVVDFDVSL
jgi:hypothetical protein